MPGDSNDILLRGGRVVDGTGNSWFHGDVLLRGDRIAEVRPARPGGTDRRASEAPGLETVDATGLVVCPGFLDIQSQSIIPFLTDGRAVSKITQGVTTEIMGELSTPAPFGGRRGQPFLEGYGRLGEEDQRRARTWRRFGDWLTHLDTRPMAVNFGSFVGGGTIREYACGLSPDEPTDDQMALMCRLTAEAMEDGAFGIAPALIYPPNSFSLEAELTELARVVARFGGTYIVHMRSEGEGLLTSLDENIRIGRDTGAPIEIYHLKACARRNWPVLPEALAKIDQARADGVDIAANMYPYAASGTGLGACLPHWAHADGLLEARLRDAGARDRIAEELRAENVARASAGPDGVLVIGLRKPENQALNGLYLGQIADRREQDWPETLMDLVLDEGPWAGAIFFLMCEENLRLQMTRPWVKFATDAGAVDPARRDGVLAHPRAYGTFPRVLGKYVRDEGALRLEDAVRRMTSAVADRLALRDRGLLRPGCFADVVAFDPATVADRSTYTDPHQLSMGVQHVWVNGTQILRDGEFTGAFPGRRLHGPGAK